MTGDKSVRVLLADDHPALRIGLRVLLDQAPDIAVVGEAGQGRETLTKVELLRPDVVVVDCQLPNMDGIAVAMGVRQRGLPTRVLALSAHAEERYVRGMIEAGAVGYLLKDEAPEKIVDAVRAAAKGESWFSPSVATKVAVWASGGQAKHHGLTERELEVLRLVATGKTNKQIAKSLGFSEKAIEKYLSEVFAKLDVSSRAAATAWVVREGLA